MLIIKPVLAGFAALSVICVTIPAAFAQENYDNWGLLKSEFESTGGGGIMRSRNSW